MFGLLVTKHPASAPKPGVVAHVIPGLKNEFEWLISNKRKEAGVWVRQWFSFALEAGASWVRTTSEGRYSGSMAFQKDSSAGLLP